MTPEAMRIQLTIAIALLLAGALTLAISWVLLRNVQEVIRLAYLVKESIELLRDHENG